LVKDMPLCCLEYIIEIKVNMYSVWHNYMYSNNNINIELCQTEYIFN